MQLPIFKRAAGENLSNLDGALIRVTPNFPVVLWSLDSLE